MWSARRGIKTVNLSGELRISEEIYFNHSATLSAEQKYCILQDVPEVLFAVELRKSTDCLHDLRACFGTSLTPTKPFTQDGDWGRGGCRIQKVNTVDDSTT